MPWTRPKTIRELFIWPFAASAILMIGTAHAGHFGGDWLATLEIGQQQTVLLRIGEEAGHRLTANLARLDGIEADPGERRLIDQISAENGAIAFKSMIRSMGSSMQITYRGRLNTKGDVIVGIWTAGGKTAPATFSRITNANAWRDLSPHKVQLVTVENNVKLEVLDWGGSGRYLVLLTGLGNSAHVFDQLALKLVPKYHVFAISRRGYGASTTPPVPAYMVTHGEDNSYELHPIDTLSNPYASDRLGDDVIAVLDALKIQQPVLAGHSIGGEELTSIGLRYPDRVAGLIYLDAMYGYAYYDGVDPIDLITEKFPYKVVLQPGQRLPLENPGTAVMLGEREYRDLPKKLLAICAAPRAVPKAVVADASALKAFEAREAGYVARWERIRAAFPAARFLLIPNANHYVWRTHETEVIREIDSFIAGH